MRNLILGLALLLSFNLFANKHGKGHHENRRHHTHQHARHAVDDLYDYVTVLAPEKRDSLVKYFAAYYDNAKTYSPTSSVRKRSRTELDTKVKTQLSDSQYKEYGVFMKDQEKKACLMKKNMKRHHRHHDFAKRGPAHRWDDRGREGRERGDERRNSKGDLPESDKPGKEQMH